MKHVFNTNYSGPAADWAGCQCPECKAALGLTACTPPAKNTVAAGVPPTVNDGQGVCINRGAVVVKGGVEYRVRSVRGRVVQLETFDGSFAFFSAVSCCQVKA